MDTLNDILGEATCYNCRWMIMFNHIAAGYDSLKGRLDGARTKEPEGFHRIKDSCMEKGFPLRSYSAGLEEFGRMPPEELFGQLTGEIEMAVGKMNEGKYHKFCGDEPISVLEEIRAQLTPIQGPRSCAP